MYDLARHVVIGCRSSSGGRALTQAERDIRLKRAVLEHAEKSGNTSKTCRYFGVPRSTFYEWKKAYEERGDEGEGVSLAFCGKISHNLCVPSGYSPSICRDPAAWSASVLASRGLILVPFRSDPFDTTLPVQ